MNSGAFAAIGAGCLASAVWLFMAISWQDAWAAAFTIVLLLIAFGIAAVSASAYRWEREKREGVNTDA